MAGDRKPALTERQEQVLALIDQRLTIKEIASELGISENRVNQHIEALKRRLGVNSLRELAARYRDQGAPATPIPSRIPSGGKSQLSDRDGVRSTQGRAADGRLVLADVQTFSVEAPWSKASEPRVVPPMLDGNHAILLRLAMIAALVIGILASLVLIITAAHSLSEVVDGRTDRYATE
jgi:DNA-binding CsgD family transcriptional regulator